MNSLSIFSKHFAITVVFALIANFAAQAQSPVESTHVDEKYAYTTVVYKNKNSNDQEVLSALNDDNSLGIGDVVRITLAPPPSAPITPIAASEPIHIDKSKGEDTWLSTPTTNSAGNLTAAAPSAALAVASTENLETTPKMVQASESRTFPSMVNTVPSAETEAQTSQRSTSGTFKAKTSKSSKGMKSVKKVKKKSSSKMKMKNRNRGKQRYACPKF